MKEKMISIVGKVDKDCYAEIELTLSDLYAQLKEQGYYFDCPTDPECPFCEPAKCEHDFRYIAHYTGNKETEGVMCIKCGEKRIEPTQKPKIEEMVVSFTEKSAMSFQEQIMMNKINELVRAVNGLYERFDRASEVIKRREDNEK